MKQRGIGWLIGRVKKSKQAVARTDGGRGGVHVMIPVEIYIAVTLTAARRQGIAQKLPEQGQQAAKGREMSVLRRLFVEPTAKGYEQSLGRIGHWPQWYLNV